METKFTPGPWVVAPMTPTRVDTQDGSISIAWGDSNKGEPRVRKAEANAILIAAAPEMYLALEAAYECMNMMGDILNGMDAVLPEDEEAARPAFSSVRAALAKARGEPA